MSDQPNKAFRAVALERATSLEQLDHLVTITRPFDWILAVVIFFTLGTAVGWGVFGGVSTRAHARGVFVRSGGGQGGALAAPAGRLSASVRSGGGRGVKG